MLFGMPVIGRFFSKSWPMFLRKIRGTYGGCFLQEFEGKVAVAVLASAFYGRCVVKLRATWAGAFDDRLLLNHGEI